MALIDLETWPRRNIHAFFLGFEDPWFNLTAEVEAGPTRRWCRANDVPFSLACWFAVLRVGNGVPAFRMRLRPDGVWLHERVRVGATVLRPDQTFAYAYFPYEERFPAFLRRAQEETRARIQSEELVPVHGDDDVIYCTVVPWVRFTGIKHARAGEADDSVPRIALGRATDVGEAVRLPVSVEGHHSLIDGVHVGAFFTGLEAALAEPRTTFAP